MGDSQQTGAASAAPNFTLVPGGFDPATWMRAWSNAGGFALATDDRLFIGHAAGADFHAHQRRHELRGLIAHADAKQALAIHLRGTGGGIEA